MKKNKSKKTIYGIEMTFILLYDYIKNALPRIRSEYLMKRILKRIISFIFVLIMGLVIISVTAFAEGETFTYESHDDISGGGTEKGDTNSTSNVYTFNYDYDASYDAIVLTVNTKNPVKAFGNTTSHTFTENDDTVIYAKSPRVGRPLIKAIYSLIKVHNINMSVSDVISRINALGYFDDGNGIYRGGNGYLTWVKSSKVIDIKKDTTPSAPGGDEAHYKTVPDPTPENPNHTKEERDYYIHDVVFDSAVSGAYNMPSGFRKVDGTPVKIQDSEPLDDGYVFNNYTSTIGQNFVPGDYYTHNQKGGTVTITAHWLSYIYYDNNSGLSTLSSDFYGGTFDKDTMNDAGVVNVSKKPAVTLSGVDCSKSIIFIGWNTKADGSGTWYSYSLNADTGLPNESDGSFSYGGPSMTLYAQYRLKYDLSYNGNQQSKGEDFTETIEDSSNITATQMAYSFAANPFERMEVKNEWDDNKRENVNNTYNYSFQGWSLDADAYFKDKRVYMCGNPNRPDGNVPTVNVRDYLSECMSFNPCRNITVTDGYVTVTTYAVWDKFPYVFGYDLSYSKQELLNMEPEMMYNKFMLDCGAVSYDREDEVHAEQFTYKDSEGNELKFNKRPGITFVNFKKSDFVPLDDFGSCTLDLMAVDTAGNVSTYRITVHTTTNVFDTSKDGSLSQAPYYTRFIDEENYMKSFDNYVTVNKSLKDLAGRAEAYANGGLEAYSKWLNDPEDSALIDNVMSQMDSSTYKGYARSITIGYDDILSVRSIARNNGVGGSSLTELNSMLFNGSYDTSSDLKDDINNDNIGHSEYTETIDNNRPKQYRQGYGY